MFLVLHMCTAASQPRLSLRAELLAAACMFVLAASINASAKIGYCNCTQNGCYFPVLCCCASLFDSVRNEGIQYPEVPHHTTPNNPTYAVEIPGCEHHTTGLRRMLELVKSPITREPQREARFAATGYTATDQRGRTVVEASAAASFCDLRVSGGCVGWW